MYLYCSIGNYKEFVVEKYSNFYEKILSVDARIYTNSLQISEFINSYCRLEFNLLSKKNPCIKDYKKDFRNSEHFAKLINHIKQIVDKKIFKHAVKMDEDWTKSDLVKLMGGRKCYDFNDEFYTYLCEKQSIMVVTNDRDFFVHAGKVPIISGWK